MSVLKASEAIDLGEGDTLGGIFAVELSHFIWVIVLLDFCPSRPVSLLLPFV